MPASPAPKPAPKPSYTPKFRPTAAAYQPIRYTAGIKLLVYYDGFTGLVGLMGATMAYRAEQPVALGIFLGISVGVLTMGGLLFTRQLWAYYLALIGHVGLLALKLLDSGLWLMSETHKPSVADLIPSLMGVVLLGLCIQRAGHLVRQVRDQQAAEKAEAEEQVAAPRSTRSWDEAPIE